jgi:hypothetical protein
VLQKEPQVIFKGFNQNGVIKGVSKFGGQGKEQVTVRARPQKASILVKGLGSKAPGAKLSRFGVGIEALLENEY